LIDYRLNRNVKYFVFHFLQYSMVKTAVDR
jgi:hypothetical protein